MKIVPIVLLIVSAAHYCNGISCYKCSHGDTNNNENCGGNFDSSGIDVVNCDGACYKAYSKQGETYIRGCISRSDHEDDFPAEADECRSSDDGSALQCICFSDNCNAGHHMAPVALVPLFLGVAVAMSFRN